ncbi:MAG: hypothetical protein ACM3ON_05285 [Chloroflexota bacterium]
MNIPPELLNVCRPLVRQFHQKNGFSNLSTRIASGDNLAALAAIGEASAVLNLTNRYYNIRKWCFLASLGVVCLSVLAPWWGLSILAVIFITDRILLFRERDGWKFLSAVLLSLEMLTNDVKGWGKVYPQERAEASKVLKDDPESPRSTWLDYYLPQRASLDPSALKDLGPLTPKGTAGET